MRYLTLPEVLALHNAIVQQTGGASGIRDFQALDSALAQPKATFDGIDLYPSIEEKAAALAYSIAQNHPFLDGNKRIAHAAMETFFMLNKFEIDAPVDEQECMMLNVASGQCSRRELTAWLGKHIRSLE